MIRRKLDYTTCVPGIVVRYPDKLHATTADMKKKNKRIAEAESSYTLCKRKLAEEKILAKFAEETDVILNIDASNNGTGEVASWWTTSTAQAS